jgi:Ca-activated chloride channel family protein
METPLHSGQTATALFELQLIAPSPPSANGDVEVATIQLEWSDPASGKLQKLSSRLMRSQLRGSFAETAPSLQLATVVAGTAEILRESPYAAHLTPSDVLQWSKQMSIGVGPAQRANFREWVALVQQMEQLMKSRRGGRAGRPR